MTNVAILASGNGSTAEALIRDLRARELPIDVRVVICNNPDAYVLERIANLNTELGLDIDTVVINSQTQPGAEHAVRGQQTSEEQAAILEQLQHHDIDLVLLLGYMKKIGPLLLDKYGWQSGYTSIYQARMLNTHPGLFPATIGTHGLGAQAYTIENGLPEGGQTLHVVASEYDTGPNVTEHRVRVEPDDTPETLFARVQAVEKEHIAADVAAFISAQETYQKEG